MKKIITLFCLIIILVAVFFFGYKTVHGNFSFGLKLIDTPTIVKEIKKISELTTMTYVEDAVINDTIVKKRKVSRLSLSKNILKGELTEDVIVTDRIHFVEIATGTIRAGFDLSKIQDSDVSISDTTLMVLLPKVEILDVIMNPSDIKPFYDEEDGEWSEEEIHDARAKLQTKALEKIEQRAIQNGILDKAEQSGVSKITSMLKSIGFKNVVVSVKN